MLVSNLTGCKPEEWRTHDKQDAKRLLELLINAAAQVSPGAKLVQPLHMHAECVVLEVGDGQPRSLANAFLKPVKIDKEGQTLMGQSITALADYMSGLEAMYGKEDVTHVCRRLLNIGGQGRPKMWFHYRKPLNGFISCSG